jgi:hypothetical protein
MVKVNLPSHIKLCISIAYHHLEKPYGRMRTGLITQQVEFNPLNQVIFFDVNNIDIPTGDVSYKSDQEISYFCSENSVTHLIDIYKRLSINNYYRDDQRTENFNLSFSLSN